jgi:transcriptional regulator with XRE-family HTH domain
MTVEATATREQGRSFPGQRFDGARFRALRDERGWSQSEVSRRTYCPGAKPERISQALLSMYERGLLTPRHAYLHRIAAVFAEPWQSLLKPAA